MTAATAVARFVGRRVRREDGAAAVELVVLTPMLALLLSAVIELGSVVQTAQVVRNAAREGSRYAAVSDGGAATHALAYLSTALAGRSDVTLPTLAQVTVSPASPAVGAAVTVSLPVTVRIGLPMTKSLFGPSVTLQGTATMRVSQ